MYSSLKKAKRISAFSKDVEVNRKGSLKEKKERVEKGGKSAK